MAVRIESRLVRFQFIDEKGKTIDIEVPNGKTYSAEAQIGYGSQFGNKDIVRISKQIIKDNVLMNDNGAKAVKLNRVFVTEVKEVTDWS